MGNRFYLVSFDLRWSSNRTNDYPKVEKALNARFPGRCWKLVKQSYVIQTGRSASDIRRLVSSILGMDFNLIVVRLRRGYALWISDPAKKAEATRCLAQVR